MRTTVITHNIDDQEAPGTLKSILMFNPGEIKGLFRKLLI